ncbi:flagellin [Clostridium beijerinckii]|uniref:flagellin N-terminal helical domain-containing protein n=1 Tax=Clostridium beijerinckii TaxID=1520 RepID=UPI00080A3743|nr:flagellin [Clostridium beijerinckii]OCA96804.1 hypothetical protein BGS1_05995 [Clostridium beijerinckii]
MIINHNLMANNAISRMNSNSSSASKSMEKLSSGLRINRAGDDAAGLAISEKMRGQIRGLDQASANAQDSISMVQTAEGALNETTSILQRMRELSVQSSTDTNTNDDRTAIQSEISQLTDEIDRIADTTEFNTKKLINGSASSDAKNGYHSNTSGTACAGTEVKSYASIGTTTVSVVSATLAAAQGTTTASKIMNNGTAAATASTKLAGLTTSGNATLGLANGDTISISMKVGDKDVSLDYKISDASTETYQNIIDTINTKLGTTGTASIASGKLQISGVAGRDNAITDVSITAKSSAGADRTAFNSNTGFTQTQVAADKGDSIINTTDAVTNTAVAVAQGGANSTLIDGVTIKMANATTNATDAFTVTVSKSDQSLTAHIGANEGQTMDISIDDMGARALGIRDANGDDINLSTSDAAETAITTIDNAIKKVSQERSKLGAIQNRLEHTINNLGTSSENLTSAESRIRDVDMAKEMSTYSKNNILSQAAQAMLAQANQQPQQVLQLLR